MTISKAARIQRIHEQIDKLEAKLLRAEGGTSRIQQPRIYEQLDELAAKLRAEGELFEEFDAVPVQGDDAELEAWMNRERQPKRGRRESPKARQTYMELADNIEQGAERYYGERGRYQKVYGELANTPEAMRRIQTYHYRGRALWLEAAERGEPVPPWVQRLLKRA
jgi:hypothetical protein